MLPDMDAAGIVGRCLVFMSGGLGPQGRLGMRITLTALATALLTLTIGAGTARTEITYPWCAQTSDGEGQRNCGFATLQQCRATLSGNGYCEENAMYRAPAAPTPAARETTVR